ncbi:universal stress protein [Nocardia fusca]|uniref:universal stress protein n=1 Tax=Nocardia fusca TaxID=941183 RepID=UPI0007A75248|nr:universal stress protein [Nocardia fusca]
MTGTEDSDPPRPIVVGVDGSEASALAVRWASETAALHRCGLHIVHAFDLAGARAVRNVYDTMEPPVTEAIRRRGDDFLEEARQTALRIDPTLTVETELSELGPAHLLIDRSAVAGLTAIGATGEGSTTAHLGSTLLAVASHGHGRVVVVRGTGHAADRREGPVVVGLDGSPSSDAAAAAAFAEADLRRAPLVAIHTWHDLRFHLFAGMPEMISDPPVAEAAEAELNEWLTPWSEKYPEVDVGRRTYLAGPGLHLIHWSESARLVVVGSRGRGGFRGLLMGSTSNIVVQRAHCPVLVAHAT